MKARPQDAQIKQLREQRDALYYALKVLNGATRRYMEERVPSEVEMYSDEPTILEIVDAAIAKAEGGAQ